MSEYVEKEEVLKQIDCWLMTGEYKYSNATHYLDKRISSIKPKSEWVSVKDRLPEKKDYVYWRTDDWFYVLCYVKSTGKMYLAFKDDKYWRDRNGNRLRYVTHWMPLPQKP